MRIKGAICIARIVSVMLVLGLLTTVAVAWWCAMYVNRFQDAPLEQYEAAKAIGVETDLPYTDWMVSRKWLCGYEVVSSWWSDPGLPVHGSSRERGDLHDLLPRWAKEFRPGGEAKTVGRHARIAHAWGWPAVALWYEDFGDSAAGAARLVVGSTEGGIPMSKAHRVVGDGRGIVSAPRYLPLRPIWSGLALDTLFYAALWLPIYGVLLLLLRWRNRWRAKRARCPYCKYDLRGADHTVCPECGHGV